MPLYKTQGIVIKSYNYGEANKILVIFTRDYGKIRAVAKGIRRTKSKFGASLELFSCSNIMVHWKENSDLYLITQTSIVNSFKKIRNDLEKICRGSYMLEIINEMLPERAKHANIYYLLCGALTLLESDMDPEKIMRWYEIKMLEFLGFGLRTSRCVSCRNAAIDKNKSCVNFRLGGILCSACSSNHEHSATVSKNAIDLLNTIKSADGKIIINCDLSSEMN